MAKPFRFRVIPDPEGFPIIPGRNGQIEWFCDGVACFSCPLPGRVALAAYCHTPGMFWILFRVPGVIKHQIGQDEVRVVFPVGALEAVATVIKARRRRVVSPETRARLEKTRRQGATHQA